MGVVKKMRKYFAIITLTSLITLSFCERPTGRQLDSQTAVWGSFSTMVDDPGAMVETNIGLDYSIVKPNCINIDYEVDPIWIKENLNGVSIQGGLDPKILLKSKKMSLPFPVTNRLSLPRAAQQLKKKNRSKPI